MQLVTTDEVVDKASEVEEEDEAQVVVATMVVRVKVMEEESLSQLVSTTSLTRSRGEE